MNAWTIECADPFPKRAAESIMTTKADEAGSRCCHRGRGRNRIKHGASPGAPQGRTHHRAGQGAGGRRLEFSRRRYHHWAPACAGRSISNSRSRLYISARRALETFLIAAAPAVDRDRRVVVTDPESGLELRLPAPSSRAAGLLENRTCTLTQNTCCRDSWDAGAIGGARGYVRSRP